MERNEWIRRIHAVRFPLAAIAAGLLLLLIAGRDGPKAEQPVTDNLPTAAEETEAAEQRLSRLLREIEGVGNVQVLLSYETSAETEYVSDGDATVIVSEGSGKQAGLTRLTRYPRYQGAVIACQGGDSPTVRLDVVQAVSRFTGLGSDKITVLKLRESSGR